MVSYLTVPTPERRPYKGGLLSVANVVDVTDGHFAQGVQFIPENSAMPQPAPGLCWTTLDPAPTGDKEFDGIAPENTAEVFALYSGVLCFAGPDNDFDARAEAQLNSAETYGIEQMLATMLNALPVLGAAAEIVEAVGRAEQWLGSNYQGLGIIHMDRFATTVASSAQILSRTGEYPIETFQQTPVANGAGYGDEDGNGTPVEVAHLFATGLVTVWRSAITTIHVIDPETNREMALSERIYAVAIDGGGVRIPLS